MATSPDGGELEYSTEIVDILPAGDCDDDDDDDDDDEDSDYDDD